MSGETGEGCAAGRSRVSAEQVELLLSFMEEHPEFAAGKQAVYSRFSASRLWRLLAERLNAAAADSAGATKSPDKWCRYWADLKYKARKKTAAGALGELTSVDERLRTLLDKAGASSGGRRGSHSDEERKPPLEEDSEPEEPRLNTEELLAEAAMRSALAAEKQAEAVAQGVEALRELVSVLRERAPPELHALHHHRL